MSVCRGCGAPMEWIKTAADSFGRKKKASDA